MNPILSAGVLIGILCSAWTFVLGFTGLYKTPSANVVFISVAMAIEVVVLTWGLRRTAAEGRAYGGQILAGTMMAIVGGVIIIVSSLLFTTVFFPAGSATPMAQAMSGFIGTLVTGLGASAIIGIFVHRRGGATGLSPTRR